MERAACALCGSSGGQEVRAAPDFLFVPGLLWHYVKCQICGLIYLSPRPSRAEMPAHYPSEYYRLYPEVMESGRESWLMRTGFNLIRGRRMPKRRPGLALDVGCGSGFYLARLREMGWSVQGIDPSEEAAAHARELNAVEVDVGPAEVLLLRLPDQRFDLVTMWHVLEHLHDPVGVLAQAHRVLKPDGLLMVEVPNFNSLCSRVFRSYWPPLEAPRHLFQFTPATLAAMLTRAGFRIDRLRGIPSPQNLCATLNLAAQQGARRRSSIHSVYFSKPALIAAAYPLEWLLAKARLSGEMIAVARPADRTKLLRVSSAPPRLRGE